MVHIPHRRETIAMTITVPVTAPHGARSIKIGTKPFQKGGSGLPA